MSLLLFFQISVHAATMKGSKLSSCGPSGCIEVISSVTYQSNFTSGYYFDQATIRILDRKLKPTRSLKADSVYYDLSQNRLMIREMTGRGLNKNDGYYDLGIGELAVLAN